MAGSFLFLVFFYGGFIALALLGAYLSRRMIRRRERAMQVYAATHGMQYLGRSELLNGLDCKLMQEGSSPAWDNAMTGLWGAVNVSYADYQYTTGSGRSRRDHKFSLGTAELGCFITPLEVKPKTVLDDIEHAIAPVTLQFESVAFNQRFEVSCPDQRFAFELIDAQMIEALLAMAFDIRVSFGPTKLVVWGDRRNVGQFDDILSTTATLVQRVPELVRHTDAQVSHPHPGTAIDNLL